MFNKRNVIVHLWSLKLQNLPRTIYLQLTKAGHTAFIPSCLRVSVGFWLSAGHKEVKIHSQFFDVDKHVIYNLGSDMWRCQDLPWWESDWPLLIIIKTRGRKVTRAAAATSAAVQLQRKWGREVFSSRSAEDMADRNTKLNWKVRHSPNPDALWRSVCWEAVLIFTAQNC